MSRSTVSRRVREFVGVALFAAALIWIISLASYEPSDPVWFFSSGAHAVPVNFAGRIGAFLAELSFQLFGYASYLIPAIMVIIGWNYFWCRTLEAIGTKATGAGLLFACLSAFLSLVFGTLEVSGKSFRAGGYTGDFLAKSRSSFSRSSSPHSSRSAGSSERFSRRRRAARRMASTLCGNGARNGAVRSSAAKSSRSTRKRRRSPTPRWPGTERRPPKPKRPRSRPLSRAHRRTVFSPG